MISVSVVRFFQNHRHMILQIIFSFLYPSPFNSCWLKICPWHSRIKEKNLRVVVVVCACVNVWTHPAQTLPSLISSFRSQSGAKQPQLWRHRGIPVSSVVRGHQSTGSITLPIRVCCDGKLPQWDLQLWAKSRSTAAERDGAAFSNSSNILDYRPHDSQLARDHENWPAMHSEDQVGKNTRSNYNTSSAFQLHGLFWV